MRSKEATFPYEKESAMGLLDRLNPQTRLRVTIPGRGRRELTVAELLLQIETLREQDIGPDVIEQIDVQVL